MSFSFTANTSIVVSGTPTTAGTYAFTVTAVNNPGGNFTSTSQTFSYTITVTTPAPLPSFSGTLTASVARDVANTTTAAGTNFTSASVTTGGVPAGMTFAFTANTNIRVSGTPTAAGSYPFTVTAVNNPGGTFTSRSQAFSYTMTVTAPVLKRCTSFQISLGCCTNTNQCGTLGAGASCTTATSPNPFFPDNC
jgi:hypothetical protein